MLYAFYASVGPYNRQTVSVAFSEDGVMFKKYEGNPIIYDWPCDNGGNFRDPAVFCEDVRNYLIVASADNARKTGTLLLYESNDLLNWKYKGVLYEYRDAFCCECPSFLKLGNGYLLGTSVIMNDGQRFFEVVYGDFDGAVFSPQISRCFIDIAA